MDHDTLDILAVTVVDKRETERKSPNMETLGFKRGLDTLLDQNVKVVEVVTDQHPGIIGLMSKLFLHTLRLVRAQKPCISQPCKS